MGNCKTCRGYGLWAGEGTLMGPMDASDGYSTDPCPECGANPNPIKKNSNWLLAPAEKEDIIKKIGGANPQRSVLLAINLAAEAQAKKMVECLEEKGFEECDYYVEPVFQLKLEDWQEICNSVGVVRND